MARILFGGPEEGTARGGAHNELVARLRQEHNVVFVDDACSLLYELGRNVLGK
ncbi:hypothetical protein HY772_08175 [Candidatus Woesearchaeota archaeon]|nr:hypothetical protein [Candidatus Woesearchaeota archaeon]